MAQFTAEEIELLKRYVTDPKGDIFAVMNMPGMTGAAYARYSRAKGGFREVLLKEFIKEGKIDPKHADELIARILVAYGDDSVGELDSAHMSFENISNLATKEIQDRRIGGSPIEQSSRYVVYDQRDDLGRFRYLREKKIMASPHTVLYEESLDFIFQTYLDLIPKMMGFFERLKPLSAAEYDIRGTGEKIKLKDAKDEAEKTAFQKTYTFDLRSKTCDTLRCLLPAATLTNVGMFGNGRFFQYLLSHLYSSDMSEFGDIALRAHRELNKLVPQYVRRAKRNEYDAANRRAMQKLTEELLANIPAEKPRAHDGGYDGIEGGISVDLLENPKDENEFRNFVIAQMLYEYAGNPLFQLRNFVNKLPEEIKKKIVAAYVGDRKTRRDSPGRALEFGYPLTFDLVLDFGSYRDIQRHRMCTQMRQRLSPYLGFAIPKEISQAGFEKEITECRDKSTKLYEALKKDFPEEASYAVLFGFNIRWTMGMNDREAMHLLELRSTPQGHPSYRRLSQLMHSAIRERSAWRAEIMKFVDYNDYFWSRADSEAKQRVKEKILDKKFGGVKIA